MNSWPASVETIARNLYERGLSGQNVLISLPRSFEFIWAFLGCLRAGAVAVPLDFPGAEIAFEITDGNIQLAIATEPGSASTTATCRSAGRDFLYLRFHRRSQRNCAFTSLDLGDGR